jgi:hypothetical protein
MSGSTLYGRPNMAWSNTIMNSDSGTHKNCRKGRKRCGAQVIADDFTPLEKKLNLSPALDRDSADFPLRGAIRINRIVDSEADNVASP